jgi:hypothetical protein
VLTNLINKQTNISVIITFEKRDICSFFALFVYLIFGLKKLLALQDNKKKLYTNLAFFNLLVSF